MGGLVSKLLKAAKGTANVAARGGVNLGTLKKAASTRAGKVGIASVGIGGASAAISTRGAGNMAGYVGGNSAYIETLGSGYQGASRYIYDPILTPPSAYMPNFRSPPRMQVTNMKSDRYNPFSADMQMAKMIR